MRQKTKKKHTWCCKKHLLWIYLSIFFVNCKLEVLFKLIYVNDAMEFSDLTVWWYNPCWPHLIRRRCFGFLINVCVLSGIILEHLNLYARDNFVQVLQDYAESVSCTMKCNQIENHCRKLCSFGQLTIQTVTSEIFVKKKILGWYSLRKILMSGGI